MTCLRLALAAVVLATPAAAHPGHIAPLAGHDHLATFALASVALAGVLTAIVLGARRLRRGGRRG